MSGQGRCPTVSRKSSLRGGDHFPFFWGGIPHVNGNAVPYLIYTSLQAPTRRPPDPRLTPLRPNHPTARHPSTPTSARHHPCHPTAARHPPTPGAIVIRNARDPPGPCRCGRPRSYRTGPDHRLPARHPPEHSPPRCPWGLPPNRLARPPPDSGSPPRAIRLQPAPRVHRSPHGPTDPAHDRPYPMQLGTPVGTRPHRPRPPPAGPPKCRLTNWPQPTPTDPPPTSRDLRTPPALPTSRLTPYDSAPPAYSPDPP